MFALKIEYITKYDVCVNSFRTSSVVIGRTLHIYLTFHMLL